MSDANHPNDLPRPGPLNSGAHRLPDSDGLWGRFWKRVHQSIVEPVERRQRQLENELASQADAITRLEATAESDRSRISKRLSAVDTTASNTASGITAVSNEIDELRAAHASLLEAIGQMKGLVTNAIPNLEGDAARARDHLARLQEDHSALKEDFATTKQALSQQLEELDRLETMWADLHHDLTGLAAILSRLEAGEPSC